MNKNLHDIDKLFKSALEQHEDIPSPGVWDAIDNKLDKNKVVDINKKYNQLKRIAILLFLLLSGVVFYEYNSHKSNKDIARKNPVQNPAASEAYQTSVSGRDSITNLESKNSNSISGEYHGLKESAYSGSALNKNNDKKKLESEIVKDNGIGNKLIRRKGKLNVNFTNAQSSVTDQDNLTNGMQAGISASKYYSPIELMPDVTRNFDEQLNKRVSNFTATNLIFSSKVNQPIGKDNAKNSKDRKNTSRPGSARLSLTPFFSPDFAFYSLTNDHPHGRGDDRHDIKKDENHEFSFTTGVLAEYALNKHISIQSGVAYSKTTINSVPKNIYAEPDNAGNVRYRLNGSCGYAYISIYICQ